MPKIISLKVAEAIQDDVNKGIVRIDSSIMHEIEVRPGEIVEIEGERKTVAIVDRAYPGDIGLNIIRMDGIIRRNAKTGIGEMVKITKTEYKEAKKVVIAPSRKDVHISAPQQILKQGLLGRAAIKGDVISMGGTRRRRSATSGSPFFDEVFSMFDETMMGFGFGDLKFIVVDTNPKQGAVIITDITEITLNPEAVELEKETVLEVSYEDIGGLREEIKKIREMVELPLKHPEIFERLGIDPPKGVLLHGPPGTGKTLLAKAVANETHSHFILINGPEIMSKYYGQSEENLRKKFEEAEKNAPSIIFIDEIDAIATKREETRGEVERRVVAQMLALMDGLKSRGKVVVIAASNIPNMLDPALRRPGRFDREIDIGVPSKEGRLDILKIHTRNMPIEGTIYEDVIAKKFSSQIENYLKENNIERDKIDKKIKEFKEKDQNEGTLNQIISKLTLIKTRIKQLEKIKKLIGQKETLDRLSRSLTEIYHLLKLRDVSDPRKGFIEKSKNNIEADVMETIEEIGNIELLNKELWDKNSSFWSSVKNDGKNRDIEEIAGITYGFVGADLSALSKEAAMIVLRKVLPDLKLQEEEAIPPELLERLRIVKEDFKEALKFVRPSAMREVLVEIPNVKWTDVGGLEEVKQELKEAVEWPLKTPEVFKRMGITPPRGILLYGPPGTGKTMLAKAVANESGANFILVNGPELLSMWVGESEKGIRKVFERARQTAPSIIFFDEIDSIAPRRSGEHSSHVTETVVNQLLTEMSGLTEMNDVIVLGATNRPDMLDTALLRPGRFDRIILTPVPDLEGRKKIFQIHAKGMHPAKGAKGVNLDKLAEKTEGYVGADIEAICREAAIFALREDINAKEVANKHFEAALKKVGPSVTKSIEKSYEELQDQFKSARAKEMQKDKPAYFG